MFKLSLAGEQSSSRWLAIGEVVGRLIGLGGKLLDSYTVTKNTLNAPVPSVSVPNKHNPSASNHYLIIPTPKLAVPSSH